MSEYWCKVCDDKAWAASKSHWDGVEAVNKDLRAKLAELQYLANAREGALENTINALRESDAKLAETESKLNHRPLHNDEWCAFKQAAEKATAERDAALSREARLRAICESVREETAATWVSDKLRSALSDKTADKWLADKIEEEVARRIEGKK